MPKVSKRQMKKDPPVQVLYEFEYILATDVRNNEPYYLVKWKGYPISQSTWETRNSFQDDCSQLDFQINQIQSTIAQSNQPPKKKKIKPVQLRRSPRKWRSKEANYQFDSNISRLANLIAQNRQLIGTDFPLQENRNQVEMLEQPKKTIFEEHRINQEINILETMPVESVTIPEERQCVIVRSNTPERSAKKHMPSQTMSQKIIKKEEKEQKCWQEQLNVIGKKEYKIGNSTFYELIYMKQGTPCISKFLVEKNASEQLWPQLKRKNDSNDQNQIKLGKKENPICLDQQ